MPKIAPHFIDLKVKVVGGDGERKLVKQNRLSKMVGGTESPCRGSGNSVSVIQEILNEKQGRLRNSLLEKGGRGSEKAFKIEQLGDDEKGEMKEIE
jgi:hypothetical protein